MSVLAAVGLVAEEVLGFAEKNPELVKTAIQAIGGGGCSEQQLIDAIKEQMTRREREKLEAELPPE